MTSLTVSFSGTSSVLRADFFPEITLNPNYNYCCALLDFSTYHSIPNISEEKGNNVCTFKRRIKQKDKDSEGKDVFEEKLYSIALPTGAYEVEDILKYIKAKLEKEKIKLTYEISVATSKVQISFDTEIEWVEGTVLNVLGFKKPGEVYKKNWVYHSDRIVKITDIDLIRIECDIVSQTYINGRLCHTIHQFSSCKVEPGHKFI